MPTDRDDPNCLVNSDAAKRIGEEVGLRAVVVFAVRKDGVLDTATWGDTPFDKEAIAEWSHGLARNTISAVPFMTAFGIGNRGTPCRLSEGAIESLPEGVREYVLRNTHPDAAS